LSTDGLGEALQTVGWLCSTVDDSGDCTSVNTPNFDRHNGESGKGRALKAKRQQKWRKNRVDGDVDADAPTREEKRREDNSLRSNSANPNCDQMFGLSDEDYGQSVYHARKAATTLNPKTPADRKLIAQAALLIHKRGQMFITDPVDGYLRAKRRPSNSMSYFRSILREACGGARELKDALASVGDIHPDFYSQAFEQNGSSHE